MSYQLTVDNKKVYEFYSSHPNLSFDDMSCLMVDMLKNPPIGFEDVIRNHFKTKKSHIMNVANEWLKNSTSNTTSSFSAKYNELCKLYEVLPMNPADFYIGFVSIPIELGLYTKRRK